MYSVVKLPSYVQCLIFSRFLKLFIYIINIRYWQVLSITQEQLGKSQSATSTFKCWGSTAAVLVQFHIFAYTAFFFFPNHIPKSQGLDQSQRAGEESLMWYYIVIFAFLLVCFSSKSEATNVFPKPVLKLKACDQSIQARMKSFCHMIVKNYLCNDQKHVEV